jgi:hypothetical protein
MEPEELKLMMRKQAADKKARKNAARQAEAAKASIPAPAQTSLQNAGNADSAAAAYVPPQLSPEKIERINRIWNDYVASLPAEGAEDADDRKRELGPRITML